MKTIRLLVCTLFLLAVSAPLALAQESEDMTLKSLKGIHEITATQIMATAEMMDEDMYAYRPTVSVRTAGQILAHLTNAQFGICAMAAGEENPGDGNYEEMDLSREELMAALKAGFEYCSTVYDNMTPERAMAVMPFLGGENRQDMSVAAILSFNSTHNYEHYGNLSTYLRMNGMVPPSSQQ